MSNYNHKFLDKTYQFGPFIYHCQLDPEFIKEFLDVWKEKLEIKMDKEEEK